MADELETLADLVNSEGWRLFTERQSREWGPAGLRFQQSVRDAAAKKEGAAEELQMILRLQSELIGLMAWPNERLKELQNQRKAALLPTLSRRGPGL
jgi:hypothetical protein